MQHRWIVAALLAACGGPAPKVEPAPPVAAQCQPLQASPASMPAPASASEGPDLRALLPGRAPVGALTAEQMLALEREPDDAQWRGLPVEADAALLTIARDPKSEPARRARALSGLAVRRSAGGDAAARDLASGDADVMVRRAAIRALPAWIEPEGGANADALLKALSDADPHTREAAVRALAPHAARPAVRDALRARLSKEDAAHVREALALALKQPDEEKAP